MLYDLTKRVARALALPLTLHHTLAPPLPQAGEGGPASHKYDSVAPEVALAAACVIAIKFVYGLDGRERCVSCRFHFFPFPPSDSSDPG